MNVQAIRTPIFKKNDDLAQFIFQSVPNALVREKIIVAVTSKIVSLSEACLVSRDMIDKDALVKREADHYLGDIGYGCHLTIKHGLFIASAGIDESNVEDGGYVLFPPHPFESCLALWEALRAKWNLQELGVVFTDSHTTPLRRGVTGISLAHAGFQAVRSLIGQPDLYGRELKMTTMNLADGLAGAAVMMMGEGSESTPLAIVSDAPVDFIFNPSADRSRTEVQIPAEEDLYFPLFRHLGNFAPKL